MNYKDLFKLAKEKGIEDLQIVYSESSSTSITAELESITEYKISNSSNLGVKGIYDGKMGTYYTEVITKKDFPFIIDKVIESAKAISSKDEVFIYEGDKKYKKIKGAYNKELNNIPIDKKIELCLETSKELCKKDFVKVTEVEYSEDEVYLVMENSKGLKIKEKRNYADFGAFISVNKDEDNRNGFEYYISNDFTKFDKDDIISKTYKEAIASIGAKPIKSGEYEAVVSERATAMLLGIFSSMFSSEMVQKNMSLLTGKIGEKIASSAVTIVDDPFLEGSSSSQSFDSDGVSTKYKVLVDKGVLKGYLYNLKTAKKDNTTSTGNAQGSGCAPINLYIKPGKLSKDELISEIKDGIYITSLSGGHAGANTFSGDFSLQTTGYRIVDGKLAEPVALVTSSANILELLKNITKVSNTLKNGVDSPAVKLKKISIAGL